MVGAVQGLFDVADNGVQLTEVVRLEAGGRNSAEGSEAFVHDDPAALQAPVGVVDLGDAGFAIF